MCQMSAAEGEEVLDLLASNEWTVRNRAAQSLAARGANSVEILAAGVHRGNWRVRAECAALMDHVADPRCVIELVAGLRDPSPTVRRHAVHSLGCQRCKSVSLPVDVVALLADRALHDESIRVRRVAVHQLGLQAPDDRAIEALTAILEADTDAKVLSRASFALKNHSRLHTSVAPNAGS